MLVDDRCRWREARQRRDEIEKPRVNSAACHLGPASEIPLPGARHILGMHRRDEPSEDGTLGMPASDFFDQREHPCHPRRVPRRRFGEHALHVDAEMNGMISERPEAERFHRHQLQSATRQRVLSSALICGYSADEIAALRERGVVR